MKVYEEEQKLREFEREHGELAGKLAVQRDRNTVELKQPEENTAKGRALTRTQVDTANADKALREFDIVKKEVDSIIAKFKPTKLAKLLGVYSEMEGVEFSWNN